MRIRSMRCAGPVLPALIVVLAAMAETRPMYAQDAHYWNNQYGTRAQLLGGLVVGAQVDLSATFYNPGAVAAITEAALIVGTDAWEVMEITGERVTEDDIDVGSSRVRPVPAMFAITIPFDWLGTSKLVFSTLTRYDFDVEMSGISISGAPEAGQDPESATFGQASLEDDLSESWFGLTWAIPVSDRIGLGATTYLAVRSQGYSLTGDATRVTADGTGSSASSAAVADYSGERLLWKLGAAADLSPVTLGVTVTTPSIQLGGSGSSLLERSRVNWIPPGGGDPVTELAANFQDELPGRYNSPLSVAAGAQYGFEKTRLYVTTEWFDSVDEFVLVDAQPFVAQTTGDTISPRWTQRWRSVVNWGLALEHEFSPHFSLYGAYFTDRSAIEDPASEANLAVATWDIDHVTLGMSLGIGSVEMTLGLGVSAGDDEERDIFADPDQVADFHYRSMRVLLGLEASL